MPNRSRIAFAVLVIVGLVGLGFAVSGLASSQEQSALQATGDETNEDTNEDTSEAPSTTKWRAGLTTGQEIPKPTGVKPGAAGTFAISLTQDHGKYSASYTLTFKNLTGKAVGAHIHKGKAGKTGPVLVALCGPCTSGKAGKLKSVPLAAASAIKSGAAYVNVHTAKNAAGELRGQVKKK